MKITNDQGRTFAVRVVRQGDRYGRDRCLTHEEPDPLMEFYDTTYAGRDGFDAEGQFVSRYYAETLATHPIDRGLDLQGGVPEWKIDARACEPVVALARGLRREPFALRLRPLRVFLLDGYVGHYVVAQDEGDAAALVFAWIGEQGYLAEVQDEVAATPWPIVEVGEQSPLTLATFDGPDVTATAAEWALQRGRGHLFLARLVGGDQRDPGTAPCS